MALVICHECGKEVSKTARSCPHCGAVPQVKKNVAYYLWIVVGLIIFWNIMSIMIAKLNNGDPLF